MHAAARTGDHDAIRRLITGGEDVEQVFDVALDPEAYERPATPLMVAAGSGDGADVETVRLLLELGADPGRVLGQDSAATFACAGLGWNYRPGGDAERLRLLLEKGAPLPPHPSAANRVLCETAGTGDVERLRVLLEHGLPADGHWDPEEAKESHRRMTEHLASLRASEPEVFAGLPDDLRELMAGSMEDMDRTMEDQMSSAPSSDEIPLFCAAESGSAKCVRLLLQRGAGQGQRHQHDQKVANPGDRAPNVTDQARVLDELRGLVQARGRTSIGTIGGVDHALLLTIADLHRQSLLGIRVALLCDADP